MHFHGNFRGHTGNRGCPCCEGSDGFSPMASSQLPCLQQSPLEQHFLPALGQLMNSQCLAHEKLVPPGQAFFGGRKQLASLCPATSPQPRPLPRQASDPSPLGPSVQAAQTTLSQGPARGREVRGRPRLAETHILQRRPPSQILSTPQPDLLTVVYALDLDKGAKSHRTSF